MRSPKGAEVGSEGGCAEKASSGRAEGLPGLTRAHPGAPWPDRPWLLALTHVYGIEDPFREFLQLVGGVLGAGLRALGQWPEAQSSCITRQEKQHINHFCNRILWLATKGFGKHRASSAHQDMQVS